jgi:hypothetical protein
MDSRAVQGTVRRHAYKGCPGDLMHVALWNALTRLTTLLARTFWFSALNSVVKHLNSDCKQLFASQGGGLHLDKVLLSNG